ncbi:MAG: NADH-quinone oxidoreductase subunit B [Myxococcota bacterium]|nr:NADH-quinone oxidoreductase subunit B [Myxococcota bacterium]
MNRQDMNAFGQDVYVTRADAAIQFLQQAINWGRKHSFFQYPFVTACCGMEFMATWAPKYDIARFGAEFPRFSPRQADLLFVVGTVNHKLAPYLRRVYDQMCEPKWVISFGACASTGGFYDNYATVQGIDTIIPVDVYIPGCPPRPEAVLDSLLLLQEKVMKERPELSERILGPQQIEEARQHRAMGGQS